ncbi:MAG: flagellar protein FlaG [Alphaproteobacteria bacterium]
MDVGLTNTSTPSSTSQVASAEKPDKAGEGERRPARASAGAEPESRPKDNRVAKIDQLQEVAAEAFAADNLKLSIQYNKDVGRFVYRGLDPETGEVVREYPPEEVLERIARVRRENQDRLPTPATGVALDRTL